MPIAHAILSDVAADERLVTAVLLRQRGADEELVALVGPVITKIIGWRLNSLSPEDRDDARQEILMKVARNNWVTLRRWQRDVPLIHYIAVIAKNHCISVIRQRLGEPKSTSDEATVRNIADPTVSQETVAMWQQLRRCMDEAIQRLSDTSRRIIELRHRDGLGHAAIATRLNRALGYVGPTLARAERYLREELREACADHIGPFGGLVR